MSRWSLSFVIFLAVVLGGGTFALNQNAKPVIRIAVMPLSYEQGPDIYRWLQSVVPVVLADKLSLLPEVRVLDPHQTAGRSNYGVAYSYKGRAAALKRARMLKANLVIWGDVQKTGQSVSTDLYLTTVDEAEIDVLRLQEQGDINDLMIFLSGSALKLARGMGVEAEPSLDKKLQQDAARDRYTLTLWGRGLNQMFGLDQERDFISAEANIAKALRIDPELAMAWFSLGESLWGLKRYDQAVSAYYETLNRQSDHAYARQRLAAIAVGDGDGTQAHEHLLVLRRLEPESAWVRYQLANVLFQLDQHKEAFEEAQIALKQKGLSSKMRIETLNLLVSLSAIQGNHQGMVDALNALVDVGHSTRKVRLSLSGLHLLSGQLEEARAELLFAQGNNPDDATIQHFLGEVALEDRQWSQAVEHFSREASLTSQPELALRYLASANAQLGRKRGALSVLKRTPPSGRQGNVASLEKARLLCEVGRCQEALDLLTYQIPPGTHRAAWYDLQGEVLWRLGEFDRAESLAKQALGHDAKFARAWYLLGSAQLRRKAYDEAAESFETAVQWGPELPEAAHNLVVALNLSGREEEARMANENYVMDALDGGEGFFQSL